MVEYLHPAARLSQSGTRSRFARSGTFLFMKTNIYIDAGNLYFGLLRKRPDYKWLDLLAFAKALLPEGHTVAAAESFKRKGTYYEKSFDNSSMTTVLVLAGLATGYCRNYRGYLRL